MRRALTFTALGALVIGPALHLWYSALGGLVTGTGVGSVLQKLFLDQFLFAPPFLAVILSLLTAAEGDLSKVLPKLKQDWANVCISNWKLWIPFQFLNFRFVPPQLTVAAANCCAVVWNVILSLLSHTSARLAGVAAVNPLTPPPPEVAEPPAPVAKAKARR